MAFQYACFLSYRHSDSDLGRRAVNDLEVALKDELALLNKLPIYRDLRNEPGYLYPETIAQALCESVCMLMVYWPQYFSHEHPYCTREYRAMVALEQRRLSMLPETEQKKGLIIPVLVRGTKDDLPPEIRENRHHAEFTALSLFDKPMRRHKKFAPRIRAIAEYINGRCKALGAVANDPCEGCAGYALPPYEEVKGWLDAHLTPQPWVLGAMKP